MSLPKKIAKHVAPVEALTKEGTRYVDAVQELYTSPEVMNYLPLPADLVGEAPTVGDTSGIVVAPAQHPVSATERGQEQPLGPDGQDRPHTGVEAAVGAYTGPPEMVAYIPLTQPNAVGTQGKRMVPVKAPTEDAYEFAQFISGAYRAFVMSGNLQIDVIMRLSGLSEEKVGFYLRQEETTHALAIRGVSTETHLTPEQDYALSILTDTSSNLNWNARMRRAGMSNAKLAAWRQNPTFDRALNSMAEQIAANSDVALIELGRLAGDGNLRAIEKSLEISGRYNPAQQSTVDAIAIINRTVEVLSKHLSDQPDLLRAIAADLSKVRDGPQIVSERNSANIFGLG